MKQNLLLGVFAVVIVVAIAGGYLYPKLTFVSGATTGSTFTNMKFSGIVVALTNQGQNGTSTSILNTDTSNRYIQRVDVGCTGLGNSFSSGVGAGIATLTLTVGTSTSATPTSITSIGAFSRTANATVIATATPSFVLSSSTTLVGTSTLGGIWQSGEYLTFWWNATSTATSTCTEGVEYIGA